MRPRVALLIALGIVGWRLAAHAADAPAETFGCEANPTGNPIGGGEGYQPIFTKGDPTATNAQEFLDALKRAKPGQVVFIPGHVDIDLTETKSFDLPAGVTIASTRGLAGSPGARLFTKRMESFTWMRTAGDNVRVTGLRIEGPYADAPRIVPRPQCLSIRHYNVEIDNCDVSAFIAAIGVSSDALKVHIHHNYIHHCQRTGLGYGVSTACSDTRVIANKFDYCRHHIASSGTPGASYEAAWNFVGPNANGHNFDVHGGADRGDNTQIAGDWFHIHHNTFQSRRPAVVIRGVASQGAHIHHNWLHSPVNNAVVFRAPSPGNKVYRNVYGPNKTLEE